MDFIYSTSEELCDEWAEGVLTFRVKDGVLSKEEENDYIVINVLNSPESDQVSANRVQLRDLMKEEDDEDETENHFVNVNNEMVLPEDKVMMQELGKQEYVPSKDKGKQVIVEPELDVCDICKSNIDSPGCAWKKETCCLRLEFEPVCKCNEIQNAYKAYEVGSSSEVRHSLGESSFSALGTVPNRISYSGILPYSGIISVRSDSTDSRPSFSFPILQSEWNISSPDIMPKEYDYTADSHDDDNADSHDDDHDQIQKKRGWMQGFLCCRF
ncbi:uncharacterized protein LOC133296971 [Gastrolobium bilobum]|uniref:uncharacterized protein LOC133296971 n=1 Tax=Gastrolobium bilobum TaxID=150636 RepID=UPI002AB18344|nr:uncharacterized protein LOC133296971 [Gastrolobium bilobum]